MIEKTHKENTSKSVEKVIIYTRVSSRKQVESGNGLESQEQICNERIRNQ
jgi:DNA invertase Pin-like site-specific DNA recombinase